MNLPELVYYNSVNERQTTISHVNYLRELKDLSPTPHVNLGDKYRVSVVCHRKREENASTANDDNTTDVVNISLLLEEEDDGLIDANRTTETQSADDSDCIPFVSIGCRDYSVIYSELLDCHIYGIKKIYEEYGRKKSAEIIFRDVGYIFKNIASLTQHTADKQMLYTCESNDFLKGIMGFFAPVMYSHQKSTRAWGVTLDIVGNAKNVIEAQGKYIIGLLESGNSEVVRFREKILPQIAFIGERYKESLFTLYEGFMNFLRESRADVSLINQAEKIFKLAKSSFDERNITPVIPQLSTSQYEEQQSNNVGEENENSNLPPQTQRVASRTRVRR